MFVRRPVPAPGLGLILTEPGAVNNWLREFWDYNSPEGWKRSFASAYGWLQYGDIPEPGKPTPGAPETPAELAPGGWTPAQASARGQANWIKDNIARLVEAERSGAWTPEGNLPLTAEWLDQYKWPLLAVAAAVGTLAVLAVVRR